MGYNTTVFILNDRLSEIVDNPKLFVEELYDAIAGMKQKSILAQTTVMPTAHADVPRFYYTHGNSIVELARPWLKEDKDRVAAHKDYYLEAVKLAKQELQEFKRYLDALPEEKNGAT